jgi:hypothetical protein
LPDRRGPINLNRRIIAPGRGGQIRNADSEGRQ